MAQRLIDKEKDFLHDCQGRGMTPVEIHRKFAARRERLGVVAPTLGNVRLALKRKAYKGAWQRPAVASASCPSPMCERWTMR